MHLRRVAAAAIAVTLIASAVACKKKRGEAPVGSCDEPKPTIGSRVCTDYYDKRELENGCTSTTEVKSDKPCDKTGSIGGCRYELSDRWYYGDSFMDAQALAKLCAPRPVVTPTGASAAVKSDATYNAEKVKENTAKFGAKSKAALASISATAVKKLPAPTGKPSLEGLKGSALLLHAEDLADPEHPKTLPYRLANSDTVASCSRVLGGRASPKEDGSSLASCAAAVVFGVVSVSTLKKPAATGTTQSGTTKTTTYSKGRMTGDVLLFRTDNGKYLGSFGYDAENVNMPVFATTEKIEAELYEQFASTLTSRALKEVPGVFLSFSLAK